jgi:predicted nucleic acid-binding protein
MDYERSGIKPRDAIHLACALKGKAEYFVTCDDKLIKKAGLMNDNIIAMNPVDFVREEMK